MKGYILFNFFSISGLINTIFFLSSAIYGLSLKNKSKATFHLGLSLLFAAMASFVYTIFTSYYHLFSSIHRYFTILFLSGIIIHMCQFLFNYPKNRAPKISKIILIFMWIIIISIDILFILKSVRSAFIYNFGGHIWDFNTNQLSKIIGLIILSFEIIMIGIGIWQIFISKGKERWVVLSILSAILFITIPSAVFNILCRTGVIKRELYVIIQSTTAMIGYFTLIIIYINNTKDKTTFMAKVTGISLVTFLVILLGLTYYTFRIKENSYDILYRGKMSQIILKKEYKYSDLKYVVYYSIEDDKFYHDYNKNIKVNFENQKINLLNKYTWKRIENINEKNFKNEIIKILNQSYPDFSVYHYAIIKYINTIDQNEKEPINKVLKYLIRIRRNISYKYNKIDQLPDKTFKTSLLKLLKKDNNNFSPFKKPILDYLNKSTLSGKELKKNILNLLIPMTSPDSRDYLQDENQIDHYISYSYVDINLKRVYNIGFSYISYRKFMHKDSMILIIFLIIIILIIIIGFQFFFLGNLITPLKSLLKGLTEVKDGNLDIHIKVKVKDEIGFLTHNFNRMVQTIKSAKNEIVKYTNNLEHMVKKRTTELNKANNDLKRINKELESLDELKNDFIANITHDFRSPLMGILNISDLSIKYNKNNDEETINSFKTIYESSIRLQNYIDRLLDIAKMDSGEIKLNINKINLKSFINEISNFYNSVIASSNIQIAISLPKSEIEIYSDEEKLEEILNNIISNAIKFIDPETGKIHIELKDNKSIVKIIISDNGIGIQKKDLENIFKRFNQVNSGRNTKFKGTGIGLAYAKQLTGYLKGKIYAESKGLDKGASFIIELKKGRNHFKEYKKIKEKEEKQIIQNTSRKEISTLIQTELREKNDNNIKIELDITEPNLENEYDLKKAIILIVEDNKKIRDIERNYLINAGYKNFILVNDGIEGVNTVYKYRPDLILCDYNLPRMKGDEFHDEIAENPDCKLIPFIFLTAIADKKISMERREKGASAFLKKPIEEKDLILTVESNLIKYFEYKKTLKLAVYDELSSLYNKANLVKNIHKALSIRTYMDISIIFIDIDHFKSFNDNFGHQLGDKIISEIGKIIKETIRDYDIAGKYGGEEFIILLPDTNIKNAGITAEKLRKKITNLKIQNKKLNVTASFGISSLIDNKKYICDNLNIDNLKSFFDIPDKKNTNWETIKTTKIQITDLLIKMADEAMYKAKKTICNKCGFSSIKSEDFNNKCPKCNSIELNIGRNKIEVFE